jgi:magnesium-transporting ATPase (P-type)
MNAPRNPPKLATWLLTRFSTARRSESLIGDLHEQFAKDGHSQAWYWRQVLIALALSALQTLRRHALSFLTAIFAGWLAMLAWFAMNMSMTGSHVYAYKFVHDTLGIANGHTAWTTIYFFTAATRVILFALAGWLAVRLHRAHPYAVAITLIASALTVHLVPWRTYKAFDFDTMAVIHNVTAIGGLLLGAAWAIYQEKTPRPSRNAASN